MLVSMTATAIPEGAGVDLLERPPTTGTMKTALLIVDVQNDFLPGGALAVPDGDEIIEPLIQIAKEVDLVIASRDWHPANHFSFTKNGGEFPTHCVQDTKGARIPTKISKLAHYTVSKGMDKDKEAFSLFAGHTLRPKLLPDRLLKVHKIERVIIGGLAMDICVRYTAHDAAALRGPSGPLVTIVGLDITRPLTAEGEGEALAAFNRSGVQVQNVAS
jgi:nicotinamidase/pyrazinamidase